MKMKEESEKVGLKLNIQKTKIKASGPITSWQIDEETMKQWETLFGGTQKSPQMVIAAMKLKETCSLGGKLYIYIYIYAVYILKTETLLCQQKSI